VWPWPADEFAVESLDACAIVRVPAERNAVLAAYDVPPASPFQTAPLPRYWLATGDLAMLTRAHFLACRHLRWPHAWVLPAHHTFSPGSLVAARNAEQSLAGDPVVIQNFCDALAPAETKASDVLPFVLLDMAFGGVGRPHLRADHGVLFHCGRLDVHVPAVLTTEHWKSLLIENPSVKPHAAAIATLANRWGRDAIPLRARILRDEAWVNASVHAGQLRDLARVLTDSMQALATLFSG
jgi:hypothetical protein